MTRSQLSGLQIGDSVCWQDPDTGDVGTYFIQDILTEAGYLTDLDDVLIISDHDGFATEIYASELH